MRKIAKFLDPYIGLMFLTILLAAALPARGIGGAIAGKTADAAIVFLFFLYGARLSTESMIDGMKQPRLQLAVLLCTFVLFPVAGIALAGLTPKSLAPGLVTGIVYLCLLPSTVQSSIAFTSIARGNVPAAICAASASNVLGVFVSPLLAGWLLDARNVQLSFDALQAILLQLLVPFTAGQMLRHWIGGWVQKNRTILGYVDRGSILLIIYVAFSRGVVDNVWGQIGLTDLTILLILSAALLLLVLLITLFIGRKILHLRREDEIVLQFCGSKKSLASGLPMASILFAGPQLGLIILPMMLFHQMQLIVCAILARRYAHSADCQENASST